EAERQVEERFQEVNGISWRDIILIVGGLFLIGKATYEIHDKLEGEEEKPGGVRGSGRVAWAVAQVAGVGSRFSLPSGILPGGVAAEHDVGVGGAALVVAVGVLCSAAGPSGGCVKKPPPIKMLALAFLILIGVMLVAEGISKHIDRGYIYFAMAFSLVVELLNLRLRKVSAPVKLHGAHPPAEPAPTGT